MSNAPVIKIYTTPWCGYCAAARKLLDAKGVQYEEIDVSNNKALRHEIIKLRGRQTVPQVFVDSNPIGDYDDLAALDQSNKLDSILGLT